MVRNSMKLIKSLSRSEFIHRNDSGQDLVEYALALPVFLLLVFGIMEFGILFMNYNTVAGAAREGARAGILSSCNAGCAETAARAMTSGLDAGKLNVNVTYPAGKVRVAVTYNTNLITGPLIAAVGGNDAVTVQSTATMNRE